MDQLNPQALVIGVGANDNPAWQIPVAAADAQALYAALVDPQGAAYPAGQVALLRDEQASPAAISDGFRRIADRSGPNDTVLISFTGHGALGDDGLYYLGAFGTQFNSQQQIVAGSGFSIADLFRALRDIRARRLLLIINACFAGHAGTALAADLGRGSVIPDAKALELARAHEGWALLTASKASQFSYFARSGQSTYFGAALVESLRGAGASPSSSFVGLFELYTYVFRQVRQVVGGLGYTQEPVLTLLQGVGPFPIARYPGAPAEGGVPIRQNLPRDTAPQVVERVAVTASGQGSVAVNAEQGSTVNVNNSTTTNTGIDFGSGNTIGNLQIGNAVAGDLTQINDHRVVIGGGAQLGPEIDALKARVERMASVDPDTRDEAALRLGQARRAFDSGDRARAAGRLRAAAQSLRALAGAPEAAAIATQADTLAGLVG
jgi:Caspase domain